MNWIELTIGMLAFTFVNVSFVSWVLLELKSIKKDTATIIGIQQVIAHGIDRNKKIVWGYYSKEPADLFEEE